MSAHRSTRCAVLALSALVLAAPASAQVRVANERVANERAASPRATTAREAKAPRAKPAKPSVVVIEREVFAYGGAGRRDPFKSLFTTSALRPTLGELKVVAIAYDPTNGGSVAILRDVNSNEQHRVRTGTLLGRMRVARIQPKAVVFTIEELGYSRQETLGLNDSTAVRSK